MIDRRYERLFQTSFIGKKVDTIVPGLEKSALLGNPQLESEQNLTADQLRLLLRAAALYTLKGTSDPTSTLGREADTQLYHVELELGEAFRPRYGHSKLRSCLRAVLDAALEASELGEKSSNH